MDKRTRKVVESILDDKSLYRNGILYENIFKKEYKARLGKRLAVKERFLGTFTREQMRETEKLIAKKPRGTWAVFDTSYDDVKCFRVVISDGSKDRCAVGGMYDSYDTPPSFAEVCDRMTGYEGYTHRKTIENERCIAANLTAASQFTPGQVFKDVKFAGEKPFSTVIVESTNDGEIIFSARRRGSPKHYKFSSPGSAFACRVNAV